MGRSTREYNPPMASRETRRLLPSTPFRSSSGNASQLVLPRGDDIMSLGTILLIIIVIALLGGFSGLGGGPFYLSLIHISEPTRRTPISYAVFCLKKKKKQ